MTAQPLEAPLLRVVPSLRLVPAPVSTPPYDDEVGTAPVLRLVVDPVLEPTPLCDDAWVAASRTPTAQLPPSREFAGRLLQGLLEVAAGVRSVKQLRRDTTPEVYATLLEALPGDRACPALRPDQRAVRSVHVQERPEGVVEVCATVLRGSRLGALALRLEGLDGRWHCTALSGL